MRGGGYGLVRGDRDHLSLAYVPDDHGGDSRSSAALIRTLHGAALEPESALVPTPLRKRRMGRKLPVAQHERLHELNAPFMNGILRIAFKLLVNNRGKFAALLLGITFAVLLMVMVTSMFAGVMRRASATVINTGAK